MTTASAKACGVPATRQAESTAGGNPSETIGVTTVGRPAATASSTLFWTPRAVCSGATDTAALHKCGATSGTAPTTVMFACEAASALTAGVGLEPMMWNRASGRLAMTSGQTSRANQIAASSLGA